MSSEKLTIGKKILSLIRYVGPFTEVDQGHGWELVTDEVEDKEATVST